MVEVEVVEVEVERNILLSQPFSPHSWLSLTRDLLSRPLPYLHRFWVQDQQEHIPPFHSAPLHRSANPPGLHPRGAAVCGAGDLLGAKAGAEDGPWQAGRLGLDGAGGFLFRRERCRAGWVWGRRFGGWMVLGRMS